MVTISSLKMLYYLKAREADGNLDPKSWYKCIWGSKLCVTSFILKTPYLLFAVLCHVDVSECFWDEFE